MPWSMPSWSDATRLLLAATALLAAGCGDSTSSTPAPVEVVWTVDTASRFEPCGCTAGMMGGLIRRAAQAPPAGHPTTLSLEGGGWSAGSEDHHRLRTAAYLAALPGAGVQAVGLGAREVALGAEVLSPLIAASPVPIVNANLRSAAGGPLGRPLVRLTVGGTAYAITGVVAGGLTGPGGLRSEDPGEAVAALAADAGAASLVVIADLDEAGLTALARRVPTIAIIVGGAVAAPTGQPLVVGRTRIVAQANHGKALGRWTVGSDTCQFTLLVDTLPKDPTQEANAAALQALLARTPLAVDRPVPVPAGHATSTGPAACATCHPAAALVHGKSGHAKALAVLTAKGMDMDPDCLRCHVTGLGQPGGWVRRQGPATLGSVSCESCHGPGSAHVASAGREPLLPVTPATCVGCHDAENSPRFTYPAYWSRIAHGK